MQFEFASQPLEDQLERINQNSHSTFSANSFSLNAVISNTSKKILLEFEPQTTDINTEKIKFPTL